jgi:hypothetical protein
MEKAMIQYLQCSNSAVLVAVPPNVVVVVVAANVVPVVAVNTDVDVADPAADAPIGQSIHTHNTFLVHPLLSNFETIA